MGARFIAPQVNRQDLVGWSTGGAPSHNALLGGAQFVSGSALVPHVDFFTARASAEDPRSRALDASLSFFYAALSSLSLFTTESHCRRHCHSNYSAIHVSLSSPFMPHFYIRRSFSGSG